MRQFFDELKSFPRRGDMILLLLCIVTSAFGCLVISSATAHTGSSRFLLVQIAAICIGIGVYALVSSVDISFLSENRRCVYIYNLVSREHAF